MNADSVKARLKNFAVETGHTREFALLVNSELKKIIGNGRFYGIQRKTL